MPALIALGLGLLLPFSAAAADKPPKTQAAKPAAASTQDKKPKARTLKELIELALTQGLKGVIPAEMSEKMGLGASETPVRRIRYRSSISPDGWEHSFRVIVKRDPIGSKELPLALELVLATATKTGDSLYIDSPSFLLSLDGNLKRAFHNKGKMGEIESAELSISSSRVKKQFLDELRFHLEDSVRLGLEFAK